MVIDKTLNESLRLLAKGTFMILISFGACYTAQRVQLCIMQQCVIYIWMHITWGTYVTGLMASGCKLFLGCLFQWEFKWANYYIKISV